MPHKPKLIIITGRPGSGKTTLSKKLGRVLYLPVTHSDEIKEGYHVIVVEGMKKVAKICMEDAFIVKVGDDVWKEVQIVK